jgi:hypothetical protein
MKETENVGVQSSKKKRHVMDVDLSRTGIGRHSFVEDSNYISLRFDFPSTPYSIVITILPSSMCDYRRGLDWIDLLTTYRS